MAQDPSQEKLVMHSVLEAENGITFMGSDTPSGMPYRRVRASAWRSAATTSPSSGRTSRSSSAGGKVGCRSRRRRGATCSELTDKFGIEWLVNVASKK